MSPAYWLCAFPLVAELGWWFALRASGNIPAQEDIPVQEDDPVRIRRLYVVRGPELWVGTAFWLYHFPLCVLVMALYRRGGPWGLWLTFIAGAIVYTACVFLLLQFLGY